MANHNPELLSRARGAMPRFLALATLLRREAVTAAGGRRRVAALLAGAPSRPGGRGFQREDLRRWRELGSRNSATEPERGGGE